MTALRPERDSGSPYEEEYPSSYGDRGTFEAAVNGLDDPLTDPLPGQHPSPWFRSGQRQQELPQEPEPEWYDPQGYVQDWYGEQQAAPQAPPVAEPAPEPISEPISVPEQPEQPEEFGQFEQLEQLEQFDDETVGLRTSDTRRAVESDGESESEGRAARRKAAKRGGRRAVGGARPASTGAPLSRVEARRAERARKPGPAAVASRAVGELFITVGVLMLLFVTYQLWWTNVRAHQQANRATHDLQDSWAKGKGKPDAFEPGQGFAIMHIPKLDVVVPIAEGISKPNVLDRGMVGHYSEGSTKTPMPDAKKGNFAVAGHRNTHGEPFRYINHLKPGDPIVVETQDKYFVYKMASILPQTSPGNTGVIAPIPKGSGFTEPGRYITLTTCTPEFTSKYRMIVWGKMVEERPRSKGKPSALVD
ncbi:class E sortase [Actinomycetota bacterium Odt1-20B]